MRSLSFAIQNNEQFEYEHDLEKMSRRYKDCITLYLLSKIAQRFEQEQPPLTAHELAAPDHLPLRLVNQAFAQPTDRDGTDLRDTLGRRPRATVPARDGYPPHDGRYGDRPD